MRNLVAFIVVLVILCKSSFAQEYKIEHFGQNVGLNNPFIYTINQDRNGYLVVGTGEGVGLFDGKKFKMFYTSNRLAENFVSASYKDSKGNIWFGHKGGGASIYDGVSFDLVHPGDGIGGIINDISEDKNGVIWYASQGFGLYSVSEQGNFTFYNDQFDKTIIQSFCISAEDYFFVGTDEGVDVYKYLEEDGEGIISKVQGIVGIPKDQIVDLLPYENGSVLVSTLSAGVFLVEMENNVFSAHQLNFVNFSDLLILRDIKYADGYLWISSLQSGLLKAQLQENNIVVLERYNSQNGLKIDAVNTVFTDREDVLWIGTYGEGLASKGSNLFTFYFKNNKINNPISAIDVNESDIWVASHHELTIYDKYELTIKKNYNDLNGLPKDNISCFHILEDSSIYVGTESKGIFKCEYGSDKFTSVRLSEDDLSLTITSISSLENKLWIGTLNGVYQLNPKSGGLVSYNISTGLAHNSVGDVFISDKKEVYIGTRSAFLSKYEDGTFENLQLTPEFEIVTINMIIEDVVGDIWISTSDHGVFHVSDTIINYTVESGLESNYCYGIQQDNNGMIWVMHNGGLSKINIDDFSIEKYDSKNGVDIRFLRRAVSRYGDQIWFGTENGVVLYSSADDKRNEVPPITSIQEFYINDKLYTETNIELPYGEYDIRVVYNGISLKKSEGVTFQTMLDGYESKWSDVSLSNEVKYLKVRDGEYTFRVKSFNTDEVVGAEASITIVIRLPIWKKWWFYFALTMVLIIIITGIIKLRERSHIRYQKELESQLALRTKEVVTQKEEIEEINKDLTDSINYAKRIQSAILPEYHEFKEQFPLSFVFNKPKDIVSGDFYWVKKFDHISLIVCADCTGHGVPGGFMSMIGTMLIFESCVLKNILDPAKILADVDFHIKDILRQTDDFESNKDGMDMGICVIDTNTNTLKYAGAMRPLYIYRYGIQHVIKGDRFSLGGSLIKNKEFHSTEYKLMSGDKLYMFSDGFADQFGGPYKRKMKLTGLNEILDQVSQLPVEKQYEEINNFFTQWKGDMSQMDDVLMIGIEIE